MNKSPKIRVLSPEEMKQQTVHKTSGQQSDDIQTHSGDCGSGNLIFEADCYNGAVISCCGVEAEAKVTVVKGQTVLDFIKCTQKDGKIVTSERCDLTLAGSGVAGTMWEGCKDKKVNDRCEWYDSILHQGKCTKEGDDQYGSLFCDESRPPY